MAKITAAESSAVLAIIIGNLDLSRLDFERARPKDLVIEDPRQTGEGFLRFLQNGGRVHVVGEHSLEPETW